MASYYFSATQNKKDLIYIIDYLEQHADKNPKERWWWYYQASYLANHDYGDKDLAIKLAIKLKNSSPDDAPIWTKQMLSIILANNGKKCESIKVMMELINSYENKNISSDEMNFMRYFLEKTIRELKEDNFNVNECIN
jgi:hypothetical protein